jgi:hypothetical protein
MANKDNVLTSNAATVTDSAVDTSKTPESLAAEATEKVTITVTVPKLTYEKVIAHKMRDVLPHIPAIKRGAAIQSHLDEMFQKHFASLLKGIENSAILKMLKANNPELFKK